MLRRMTDDFVHWLEETVEPQKKKAIQFLIEKAFTPAID